MKSNRLPVAFIGHGSPMNIIADNDYTRDITDYARHIGKPSTIVVISAHWVTHGTYITGAGKPGQIYDFYGFPESLYRINYSPKGKPTVADQITSIVDDIRIDERRGIDHAAWSIAKHMFPAADIPLLEISLDVTLSPREHFERAKKLAQLRNKSILFIGSGNLVHNLRDISFDDPVEPFQWAIDFDMILKKMIDTDAIDQLIDYEQLPHAARSIPTNEHYLPLLYVLGMKHENERLNIIHESIQNGSISMRSFDYSL